MKLNLWPRKRSLIAKVKQEAGVHDVFTFNPRTRGEWILKRVPIEKFRKVVVWVCWIGLVGGGV